MRRRQIEADLKRARYVYDEGAVGYEARIRWRREIDRLEAELAGLDLEE